MNFEYSDKVKDLLRQVRAFMEEHVIPNESTHSAQLAESPWETPPIVEALKARARAAGLWNLFLPDEEWGAGLDNRDYAPVA